MGNYYKYNLHIKPFARKRKLHFCFRCGTPLMTFEHSKVVSRHSPDAVYYKEVRGMIGPCTFKHNAYRCSRCDEYIEPMSQEGLEYAEDTVIDICNKLNKKGHDISIEMRYENVLGEVSEKPVWLQRLQAVIFVIKRSGIVIGEYREETTVFNRYERPVFLNLNKWKFIRYIKKLLDNK